MASLVKTLKKKPHEFAERLARENFLIESEKDPGRPMVACYTCGMLTFLHQGVIRPLIHMIDTGAPQKGFRMGDTEGVLVCDTCLKHHQL